MKYATKLNMIVPSLKKSLILIFSLLSKNAFLKIVSRIHDDTIDITIFATIPSFSPAIKGETASNTNNTKYNTSLNTSQIRHIIYPIVSLRLLCFSSFCSFFLVAAFWNLSSLSISSLIVNHYPSPDTNHHPYLSNSSLSHCSYGT